MTRKSACALYIDANSIPGSNKSNIKLFFFVFKAKEFISQVASLEEKKALKLNLRAKLWHLQPESNWC